MRTRGISLEVNFQILIGMCADAHMKYKNERKEEIGNER